MSAGSTDGTAVTVSANELVSGTKSITTNGTSIDVTDYANVDVNVSNSYTITLINGSSDSNNYIQLNHTGTTYSANGNTINFSDGDELYIYCRAGRSGNPGTIRINGTVVASNLSGATDYTLELPKSNITVQINFGLTAASIDVTIPSLGITTNGTYDVSEYALANVNVASSGGDTYTLTSIVPQQTITPTMSPAGGYQSTVTHTGVLEVGKSYLITYDNDTYVSESKML